MEILIYDYNMTKMEGVSIVIVVELLEKFNGVQDFLEAVRLHPDLTNIEETNSIDYLFDNYNKSTESRFKAFMEMVKGGVPFTSFDFKNIRNYYVHSYESLHEVYILEEQNRYCMIAWETVA